MWPLGGRREKVIQGQKRSINRQVGELDGTTDTVIAAQVLREEVGMAYECRRLL